MRLLKPSWVNHDGEQFTGSIVYVNINNFVKTLQFSSLINLTGSPIFSVDLHPDGSRFATGGQGMFRVY